MELINPIIEYSSEEMDFLNSMWKQYPYLTGYPELWKPIENYVVSNIREGKYFISSYGRVYSTIRNKFLMPIETSNGYFRVRLEDDRKYYLIHRLVLMTFNPNLNMYILQVNHKDGIKSHNWFWNLEWTTCLENIHHAINSGLRNMNGENHPMNVISEEIANKIGYLLSTTQLTANEIALIVGNGATESIVRNIFSGCSWKNIYEKYSLDELNRNPRVLDNNDLHRICKYYEDHICEYTKTFGWVKQMILDVLTKLSININSSTIRIAMRLYEKSSHKDICNLYNY